jgi:thymidylate synthase
MTSFERQYLNIAKQILDTGYETETRNATTKSIFGPQLIIDMLEPNEFPIITTRKIFYSGVFGEFAAFLRGPKNIKDFEDQGCNYWKLWADNKEGEITLSYGNDWINWGSSTRYGTDINQIENVIHSLKYNPNDRRHIITGWNPAAVEDGLSLPCCHCFYQYNVSADNTLDLMYYQRSADWAVGVPSNIVMSYLMLILMAQEVGMIPGKVIMNFGNAHLYEKHWDDMREQITRKPKNMFAKYTLDMVGKSIFNFTKDRIKIENYNHHTAINYYLYK